MDINLIREAVLVLGLVAFAAIVWWAYAPNRRARFERDALSVFDDERNDAIAQGALSSVPAKRNGV